MCGSPSPYGDAQNPADQAEGMRLRPYVRSGKAWAFLHGAPIAHERRPFRNFGAEAGKFHAREKHGPNYIGNAVGRRHHHRAAIVKRLLQPIHEANRFGAASLRKPYNGSRVEDAGALGEDHGARLVDLREIGIFGGTRQQAAMGGFQVPGNHDPRQGIAGENPAEGQFFDRIGVMEVEPRFRLAIERRFVDAQRICGAVAALIECPVRQHQGRHGHVRIEPHIVRLLLSLPDMDLDEDGLIGDAAFGKREARDHRIVRGWRVIETWLGAGKFGGLRHRRMVAEARIGPCMMWAPRANGLRGAPKRKQLFAATGAALADPKSVLAAGASHRFAFSNCRRPASESRTRVTLSLSSTTRSQIAAASPKRTSSTISGMVKPCASMMASGIPFGPQPSISSSMWRRSGFEVCRMLLRMFLRRPILASRQVEAHRASVPNNQ